MTLFYITGMAYPTVNTLGKRCQRMIFKDQLSVTKWMTNITKTVSRIEKPLITITIFEESNSIFLISKVPLRECD